MSRLSIFLLLCWVPLAGAQTADVTGGAVSLSAIVRAAVEHNFDLRIEEKGVDLARLRLSLGCGAYDVVLRPGVRPVSAGLTVAGRASAISAFRKVCRRVC